MNEDMEQISRLLELARPYGLECEVVFSIMQYMREHAQADTVSTCSYAAREWDLL